MINSNNPIIAIVAIIVATFSGRTILAGEVTEYNDLNLVTFRSEDNIEGYYRAINGLFSCQFMFVAKINSGDGGEVGSRKIRIKTFDFVPHKNMYSYEERDPRSDIPGEVYLHKGGLVLKTDSPHCGCQSAAGFFGAEPGQRGEASYSEMKRYPSIGIGVAVKKTYFYEWPGAGRRRSYVTAGDYVVLIKSKSGFTYIRFVNPDMQIDDDDKRKIATGWVHSADLVNPFPPASKEPKP